LFVLLGGVLLVELHIFGKELAQVYLDCPVDLIGNPLELYKAIIVKELKEPERN
jgi:hypothetical protein